MFPLLSNDVLNIDRLDGVFYILLTNLEYFTRDSCTPLLI
jgi:hypothetical protein